MYLLRACKDIDHRIRDTEALKVVEAAGPGSMQGFVVCATIWFR